MQTKQCSRCKEVKPLSRFYKKSANEDGLESQCKQCYTKTRTEKREAENEYLERCFAKNPKHAHLSRPEYVKEAKKQAEQQRKKKERQHHQYYINRRERIKACDQQEVPEYQNKWKAKNLGKRRTHWNTRYEAKKAAGGSFTTEQFKELCEQYSNRCLCCGKIKKLAADHIVSLCKGGTDDIKNIQPLCKQCNSSKATKTIDYRPDLAKQASEEENKS